MTVDIILLVLGSLLMLAGIIGCVVPFIPGPPLCYVGLLMAHFTAAIQFTPTFLLLWATVVIAVTLIEYLIPVWGAKKFGGTKAGMWGSAIGLVLGIILFSPFGILVGPILGAFVGELIANRNDLTLALKSAIGAFIGFVLSTGLKLTVCFVMTFYFVKEIVTSFAG